MTKYFLILKTILTNLKLYDIIYLIVEMYLSDSKSAVF